ncbi:thiamine-monophosphate kinase [Cellulomonas flavigena DSM 20109]|uniref:Thiamine-monophosphate kinase n=1 Tax=Cellulomonas flavigena (strain ATCC 482 / DSM 20109 / BCRC 11376 / JCM 18109 / NBRC 3775 / NCIMB 8073 / NRS 134) TaxID=446466 RepID=D5UGV0_CELFN|nr:thiamine-phosphate kinase [Cellulomonas flavigena]ADG75198.1 thiamine-monophosphate kinase [Cellulomonas flavigena DSM 20109]
MPVANPVVTDLSEQELLARIFPLLPVGSRTLLPPGDDAAVVTAADGRYVVTCDVLVEDVHFRTSWSTGHDVGRRAAAQNLADVAAMGARPVALVVALVVPGATPVAWVEGLARGLGDACRPLDAGVVGGDLSSGPVLVVSVTAHGDLEGRPPVRRDGARAGDVVAHAGRRGWSAAGLELLLAGAPDVDPGLVAAHRVPDPPLEAGPAAARAGATSMLDVSDGLLRDATRLAHASGVTIDLDEPLDVLADDAARLAAAADVLGADVTTWLLTGGEDHGLLATFPPDVPLPDLFRRVGTVTQASSEPVRVAGGPPCVASTGWDHFRPRG